MTLARLQRYAAAYAEDTKDPLVSPLFADLCGLPETKIFVGGDEIMRDDATQLYDALLRAGCQASLTVAPGPLAWVRAVWPERTPL